jgi:hypothetical protein
MQLIDDGGPGRPGGSGRMNPAYADVSRSTSPAFAAGAGNASPSTPAIRSGWDATSGRRHLTIVECRRPWRRGHPHCPGW